MLLLNRELGEGLYSLDRLGEIAAGDRSLLLTSSQRGRVVAASVARLLEAGDVDYYERFGRVATELFALHRVGSLEALAVEPALRRQGLGRVHALERMRWMAAGGYDAAVGVAWLSGRPDSSESLYRSLDFSFSEPVPDFYLEESLRDGWACPRCGGPCRCSAAFFWKSAEETRTPPRALPPGRGGNPGEVPPTYPPS